MCIFIYCVSLAHNILPHFSSSQLSSLNAISSCLPHNPLSHQYISNIMLTKRRKIHIQSVIVLWQCFPSRQRVEIWMNFWFRSISHALVLIFLLSSLSEHSFPFLIFLPSEWVRKRRVRKELAIINKAYAINLWATEEESTVIDVPDFFIEIMNLWSLWRDYIIEYERAQAKEKGRERETLANNWNCTQGKNRYCHRPWMSRENSTIIVILNFIHSNFFLHCCALEFSFSKIILRWLMRNYMKVTFLSLYSISWTL